MFALGGSVKETRDKTIRRLGEKGPGVLAEGVQSIQVYRMQEALDFFDCVLYVGSRQYQLRISVNGKPAEHADRPEIPRQAERRKLGYCCQHQSAK